MFFRKLIRTYLRFFSQLAIKRYKPFIIAVTGNTGKTSTKEAIYTIIKAKFGQARKTPKNLNTDIGVPLAILDLEDARRDFLGWIKNFFKTLALVMSWRKDFPGYLILELAADRPGEIKYFSQFLPIDIGIVTTIGQNPVHLEFFPNRDKLIEEKKWIIKGIKKRGLAILNKDDQDVKNIARDIGDRIKTLFYGRDKSADLNFSNPKNTLLSNGELILEAKIKHEDKIFGVKMKNFFGEGNLYDISAALMCGIRLGVSVKEGIKILESNFKPLTGRMKMIQGIKKSIIIDDSYNASPLSYLNALESLRKLEVVNGRKIVVLGDMAELGGKSASIHQDTLRKAISFGDIIFCVGPKMKNAFKNVRQKSSFKGKFYFRENSKKTIKPLIKIIQPNDLILIKGAQMMRMEKIVKGIMLNPSKAKNLLVRQEKYWLKS